MLLMRLGWWLMPVFILVISLLLACSISRSNLQYYPLLAFEHPRRQMQKVYVCMRRAADMIPPCDPPTIMMIVPLRVCIRTPACSDVADSGGLAR